jgi:type IV pilus assembly protein PilB
LISNRKRLGDILIEAGLLTPGQLDQALGIQQQTNELLGKIIIKLGFVNEQSITKALEVQLGVPYVDISKVDISKEASAAIPVTLAERWQIIPLARQGKKLRVAMVDPTNFYALDDIRLVTGCDVEPVIAAEQEIIRAIHEAYGVQDIVANAVSKFRPDDEPSSNSNMTGIPEEAPAISIVNLLISQAVKQRASDIHIEPQDNNLRVRFRIDGVLHGAFTFPQYTHASIVSRIKIMSEMDIAEKRLPQDGRIKVQEAGRDIDIRVSTIPTILGEKVVLRILDKQAVVLDLRRLGFSENNLRQYQQMYARAYGMILITGPTGSGKTTTLYSTLKELNTGDKNIITIEDPVEYRLDGVNQVQVNDRAGLSFGNGLRSILRQDPNVVMVGEIRDRDTAEIAIRAALTGHLVLTTLHTNDAAGAIARLIDMGIEPFLITSSVLGVVAQRLVRLICPDCKRSYQVEPGDAERSMLTTDDSVPVRLFRGVGCPQCHQTGYRGRIAIHEVLAVNHKLRQVISKRAASNELASVAKQAGMRTMWQDGLQKVLAGLTTIDEIRRVAYAETDE